MIKPDDLAAAAGVDHDRPRPVVRMSVHRKVAQGASYLPGKVFRIERRRLAVGAGVFGAT